MKTKNTWARLAHSSPCGGPGNLKRRFSGKAFLYGAALALGIPGGLRVQAQSGAEAWVQRYDGSAIVVVSEAAIEKLVADSSGNVIVAGFGSFQNGSYSGLLIKYSGAGVPLWTNRDNVSGNAYQSTVAVATDSSSNVFVAGTLNGTGETVCATFKYSGAGEPLWTNLGPHGVARAVAVDGSGNVFVTGELNDTNGNVCATFKYSGAGVALWTNYAPSGVGQAVAVDASGDLFVTGTWSSTNGSDYATIKYSGAGVPLWTNRYSVPGIQGAAAMALAVDSSGDAVVTGLLFATNGTDYATIKYSGAGVPLWTNRFKENDPMGIPPAVAVDGSGNVFMTASVAATNGSDYATIKYSGAGVPLWTNRFKGNDPYDYPTAVAVDDSGDVFVTGNQATIKYSSAGVPLWTNYGGGIAMAVDESANVFVTGNPATIKYSGAGLPLWTNRCIESAVGGDDRAKSVAVDGNGNVFVAGDSFVAGGSYSYATVKYSGAGVALWTNRYNVGIGGYASALGLDGSGNVFVTGRSYETGVGSYTTIKYSGAGVPLWTNSYNGPGNYEDSATALVVDSSGNAIVTGYSYGFNGDVDYATIKYSGAGAPLWTNRYNGTAYDAAIALAVDGGGNVFVTGSSYSYNNDLGTYYDYATIKYSSAGLPMWTNRYNGAGNYNDYAAAMAVDRSGNAVVTGDSFGNGSDYATIKYSSAGVPLWTNRYNGPRNGDDRPTALAVDSSDNVIVTGYSAISDIYPYKGYVTIKYTGAGVPVWTNRYNAPGNGDDQATSLAVDRGGDVIVTGHSFDTNGNPECATIKYSGAGVPLWTNRYHGGYATALAVDGDGNVFVTGYVIGGDGSYDYLTIKYSPAGVPLLTIARTTTNTVAVSWPSPSTGFRLQQNSDLATTNWSPVGTTPADNGITKTVIVDPPVRNRFYRLGQP